MGKAKKAKPSARMRRAQDTNTAVERVIACTARATRDLNSIPGAADNITRLRRGQPARWPRHLAQQYGAESVLQIADTAARSAVVGLWRQQGRIAYDIHPEMAASLYRSDMKGKLPGGLFQRLPHISPMIPLPQAVAFPFHARNGLIRGYFLTGLVGEEGFCPTTDPRARGLAVMPWIEWEGADPDDYMEVATPLFALPDTSDPFTLQDVLDHTATWHHADPGGRKEMQVTRQILPGLMSILSYLCCDNRDVREPSPVPAARGARRGVPDRDPFYVRVGWHIGPRLHDLRVRARKQAERDGVAVPSGTEYGPQHRVAHFKTVHHGPGRSLQSLRFVEPYWTKRELLEQMWDEGLEPGTGVIPVDAQTRDPSGHKDVRRSNLGRAKEKEIRERETQRQREETMEW